MKHKSGYVAILGVPNSGKSTLLNSILNQKIAPVTDKPQTTRQNLKGIYSTDNVQIIFLDTPGVHDSPKQLNQFMHAEIEKAIRDADILCYLVAADTVISQELVSIFKNTPSKPSLVLVNKVDLPIPEHKTGPKNLEKDFPGLKILLISALEGRGVKDFLEELIQLLPEGPAYFPEDQLTDTNLRCVSRGYFFNP